MASSQNTTIGLLVATALILAAMVAVQLTQPAEAASTPDRASDYIILPSQIDDNTDVVYVIHTRTQRLVAYVADDGDEEIALVAALNLPVEFQQAFGQ